MLSILPQELKAAVREASLEDVQYALKDICENLPETRNYILRRQSWLFPPTEKPLEKEATPDGPVE